MTSEMLTTDERLANIEKDATDFGFTNDFMRRNDVLWLVDEIKRLRRGEFICSRCGIRKDGEKIDADF